MIYQNDLIFIEIHESEVPWLKIFAKKSCREMSECYDATKREIYRLLDLIEREMIDFFKPKKINIASFGNMLPQVHWHIMARFEDDSYYPEPMWGKKMRDGADHTKDLDLFIERLRRRLHDR